MPCKNICGNFKTVKTVTGSPYLEGEKWCGACCIFIEWEGIHCPCCRRKLRVNPRSKRSWCYATLRIVRHNLDEDKSIELMKTITFTIPADITKQRKRKNISDEEIMRAR